MILTKDIFNDTADNRPSVLADLAIYAAAKKKVTKEFMTVVNIIKKELNYKKWISPDADIMKDLKATKKQFDKIVASVANRFKLNDTDKTKLASCKTPTAMEKVVSKYSKKK